MRRVCTLFLILVLLLCFVSSAAASPENGMTLGLDSDGTGQYQDAAVTQVQVTLDGALLECDVPAFIRDGRTMVPVRAVAEKLGAEVKWFAETSEVAIILNGRTVRLKIGSAQALVNGEQVTLYSGVPAMIANYNGIERTMVPLRFVSEQLGVWVNWNQESGTAEITTTDPNIKTIVIDAGHGGVDGGAYYEGVCEKDVNLAVALRLEQILTSCGYHVIMTRSDDTYVGLNTRASIANKAGADIFVSVHSNVMTTAPDYTGIYTFYYNKGNGSIELAKAIQGQVCSYTGAVDRGVARGNYAVLRTTRMSAALVEMGFMTNHQELQNLVTPAYQDKMAEGIARGIIDYINAT